MLHNWNDEQVARAIELLDAEGKSIPEIARELTLTPREVRRSISIGRTIYAERSADRRRAQSKTAIPDLRGSPAIRTVKDNAMPVPRDKSKTPVLDENPGTFREIINDPKKRCLWPKQGSGPDMVCCGAPVEQPDADRVNGSGNGGSYCAYHRDAADGNGTRSERGALEGLLKD